jgi:tripartite-type tricarboxylate transporter receptor subunit TctC
MKHRARLVLAMALATAGPSAPAAAQAYPTRTVTIFVGLAPGTGLDTAARTYGEKLAQNLGRPVVIDNRPGASGIVAVNAFKGQPPDGHALIVLTSAALAINPTLFKQLPYDPVKDFVPILLYVKSPFVLIVHPSLPVRAVPELMELARARPGQLSYASSGIGGASRLAMEMTMAIYGVKIAQVQYKLSTQAISDVAAGHVHIGFAEAGATQALIRSGRLRPLAVSSQTRFPTLPEVPTMAEAIKRPDFEAVSWHVLLAPSATSAAIVKRLHGEMTQIIKLPEVHDRIAATGLIPQEPRSIEENRQYIAAETKKWGALVVKLGLAGTQ